MLCSTSFMQLIHQSTRGWVPAPVLAPESKREVGENRFWAHHRVSLLTVCPYTPSFLHKTVKPQLLRSNNSSALVLNILRDSVAQTGMGCGRSQSICRVIHATSARERTEGSAEKGKRRLLHEHSAAW